MWQVEVRSSNNIIRTLSFLPQPCFPLCVASPSDRLFSSTKNGHHLLSTYLVLRGRDFKVKKKHKLLSPGIYTVTENKFLYMINYNLKGNKNSLPSNYLYLYLLTGEDFWGGGSWWQRGARKAHFVSFYFLSYQAACWILFSSQRLNMHASGVLTTGLPAKSLRKVHFGWCIILSTTFASPLGEFVIILYWI